MSRLLKELQNKLEQHSLFKSDIDLSYFTISRFHEKQHKKSEES